jgi:fructose-1,6-bisphosphatase/inositol monophosphatase family enzyme
MIPHVTELLTRMRAIQEAISTRVVASCEQQSIEELSEVVDVQAGDMIFAIDRISEAVLVEQFADLAQTRSLVLIAEGLGVTGEMVLPAGTRADEAELRIIIDPIDGTRGIMYQKRPAWILTGVALNHGAQTDLQDIELAVQTEVPLVKQDQYDCLWAIAGHGAQGERVNRKTHARAALPARPSLADTIANGYGGISRFFPGGRAELAAIDDELVERAVGPGKPGVPRAFEDQYICTGGQLYELLMGHDRWIADLRPLIDKQLRARGEELGLCCHPYDLCTELIAREAGLLITDEHAGPLTAPLDVTTGVSWIGYANQRIQAQVAPLLQTILQERGFL